MTHLSTDALITEALVFGERAGRFAADHARRTPSSWDAGLAVSAVEELGLPHRRGGKSGPAPVSLHSELQDLMWEHVGPFRSAVGLKTSLERIKEMQRRDLSDLSISRETTFNLDLQDWFELRAMLTTAEAVVTAALARTESRGAHQRLDFPESDPSLVKNQVLALEDGRLAARWVPVVRSRMEAMEA